MILEVVLVVVAISPVHSCVIHATLWIAAVRSSEVLGQELSSYHYSSCCCYS